jgi:hypothetical protein
VGGGYLVGMIILLRKAIVTLISIVIIAALTKSIAIYFLMGVIAANLFLLLGDYRIVHGKLKHSRLHLTIGLFSYMVLATITWPDVLLFEKTKKHENASPDQT